MTLFRISLVAASLVLVACGGSEEAAPTDAQSPEATEGQAAEAAASDTAPTDSTAESTAPAGHEHADGGHEHADHGHAEGAESHHGEAGEELTGFDKMRAAGNPRDVDGWTMFGKDFTLTEAQPVATVLTNAADHDGKTVRVEGTVADVCSKMGCWMVLQAGEETIRITMKEHGFGIDRDCAGKTASLEGVLQSKKVDPELAKHYAEESRKPDSMPETGKDTVYEIVATSVALKAQG